MHQTILGIEGTAWNLSAGIVTETDVLAEATATYQPKTGGTHPREAVQHRVARIAKRVLCPSRLMPLIGVKYDIHTSRSGN